MILNYRLGEITMINYEFNKNIQADLEEIATDEIRDEKKKKVFFKWCEEEYGLADCGNDVIFDLFDQFSQDAKCHYETLITSYIILMDDMKIIMKDRLHALASDCQYDIQESKQLLDAWEEKVIQHKEDIEKEIIAAKEMLKQTENFLDFCKKYKEN